MVVIDQHALHERIIYEQLRSRRCWRAIWNHRNCWCPNPSPLPPAEAATGSGTRRSAAHRWASMSSPLVETLFWFPLILPCWPTTIQPRCLRERCRTIDGRWPANRISRDLVDELLHMISCKAAIKAGDKLTPEEINASAGTSRTLPGCPSLPAWSTDLTGFFPGRTGSHDSNVFEYRSSTRSE